MPGVRTYPRLLAPRLREALRDTPAVLVHGPRQSGKTTLARAVGEAQGYRYVSFDDDATLAGCTVMQDFDAALEGVDAVMMLRLQRERMADGLVASLDDYHRDYGLTAARLRRAAPGAVVLHPGPMNRGVEIDDDVADGLQSLVLRQVANGVAVRMAVLEALLGRTPGRD